MRLREGDVLVKKRGGASRRVKVVSVGRLSAILESLAPRVLAGRRNAVRTHAVNLGEDGLPEGYRREVES
jgi:hypothetical protein